MLIRYGIERTEYLALLGAVGGSVLADDDDASYDEEEEEGEVSRFFPRAWWGRCYGIYRKS